MDVLLILARLLLAGVFLVAGIAKLADRRGSVQAMRDFGVPAAYAPVSGTILPIAEIGVAIALIPVASARWGAMGALVLLLTFVAGIGFNLARGNQPDCHCFGQLHSEPAGWPTLVRNSVLAAIAGGVVIGGWNDPGASVVAWLGDLSALEGVTVAAGLVALALLVVEGWALVHLLGQNGRLLLRLEALEAAAASGKPLAPLPTTDNRREAGLPVGSKAPTFELAGIQGERVTLGTLTSAGKPVLLIFSDPGCGPCHALLPDIGRWQKEHGEALTIAVVTRGDAAANTTRSEEHGIRHVLLQEDREVARSFQSTATPSAVLIRVDGTIGSPLVAGSEAITGLVRQATGTSRPANPAPVANGAANGSANGHHPVPAQLPDVRVSTLEGEDLSLTSLRGEETALLFWNPGCGYCARMLDDLKAAELQPREGLPRIVLISTGDPERNRSLGLRSTILLDQGFAVGRTLGASGTPSAILVDETGGIMSSVAVGATSVLALISEPALAGR